jgi:hypothetical protein
MKFWVLFKPLADIRCFEIPGVIEKKDDLWSLAVTVYEHLKILYDVVCVAISSPVM